MQIPHGAASGGDLVDAALWSDFCNRLKEGIFATLETRVAEAEENIRSMDAKRMMEGWNFCNFFATKVLRGSQWRRNAHADKLNCRRSKWQTYLRRCISSRTPLFNTTSLMPPFTKSCGVRSLNADHTSG